LVESPNLKIINSLRDAIKQNHRRHGGFSRRAQRIFNYFYPGVAASINFSILSNYLFRRNIILVEFPNLKIIKSLRDAIKQNHRRHRGFSRRAQRIFNYFYAGVAASINFSILPKYPFRRNIILVESPNLKIIKSLRDAIKQNHRRHGGFSRRAQRIFNYFYAGVAASINFSILPKYPFRRNLILVEIRPPK